MGRGVAYQYEYFMLVDDTDWDEFEAEYFVDGIKSLLKLEDYGRTGGRDTCYIGETKDVDDTVLFFMNYSGGYPALYAEYSYSAEDRAQYEEDYEEPYEAYKERIETRIREAFNKLIRNHHVGAFRFPTSAWTSEAYSEDNLYS
jgi:hypothetical protein